MKAHIFLAGLLATVATSANAELGVYPNAAGGLNVFTSAPCPVKTGELYFFGFAKDGRSFVEGCYTVHSESLALVFSDGDTRTVQFSEITWNEQFVETLRRQLTAPKQTKPKLTM